jgi:hypothetical protein
MATYFTDMSEYATGTGNANFNNSINGPGSGSIVESAYAGVTGGKVLDIHRRNKWNVPTYDNANAEMVLKWRKTGGSFNGSYGVGPVVWPRCHQLTNPASSYVVGFIGAGGAGSNNWTIGKVVGNWTNYTSYSSISPVFNVDSADWWWARVRLHEGTLSYRAWEDGDTEPGSWDASVSVDGVTVSYDWQFGLDGAWAPTMHVDVIGFATDGDTAPTTGGGGGGASDNAIFFGCNFRRSHSILVPDMRLIHPRKKLIVPGLSL